MPRSTPPAHNVPAGWLETWQEAHRQNAQTHAAFTEAMAQSHGAYMRSMESSITALAGMLPGESTQHTLVARSAVPMAAPQHASLPQAVPAVTHSPIPAPVPSPVQAIEPASIPAPQSAIPVTPPPAQTPAAPAAAVAPAAPAVDLHALMLQVVSEKTGYPAEMLELTMDLEGDLGIDSIKRVQILAAVQEQAPGMPDVDASHMSTLKTLGEIVHYMQSLLGAPATTAAPAADLHTSAPQLGRYALQMVPVPHAGLAQPGLFGAEHVVITNEGGGLAETLATTLCNRGLKAQVVDTVLPSHRAVIFLGGMRAVSDVEAAIAVQRETYAVARTLAKPFTERGGVFVTVQDTGGAFGTTEFEANHAYLAGLTALVKTASQEWSQASVKAIDLQRGEQANDLLATKIADEILLGGGELEVGLPSSGERLVPRSIPCVVTPQESPIKQNDVVLVSGGARGVTAACIIQWAKACKARFVLLGRSPLIAEPACCVGILDDAGLKRALLSQAKEAGEKLSPSELSNRVRGVIRSREIEHTLAAIKDAGSQARYRAVSVTDQTAVDGVIAETRADWGPVRGLIHGAGVLADRLIADQTDSQFDHIFNTKVEGLRTLLRGLEQAPLAVIGLFSSVSARCGNNGQSTYAMANETLNKVAWSLARANGGNTLVKSFGWGPWEGGMVSPELKAHFAKLGVPMIPLDTGAQMFVDELQGSNPEQTELVLGGEPRPESLLVVGSESRTLQLEVKLGQDSHAYLGGHCIEGSVVVPVALVLEWFSRMTNAYRPDLQLQSIDDLKVLNGLKVNDFHGKGERLTLTCHALQEVQETVLALQATSPDGTLRYCATAQMVDTRNPVNTRSNPEPLVEAWGETPVYGKALFHTDAFQVIQSLEGVGESGITGTLNGVQKAKWSWETWNTDVAALDGGLQMLLLWAQDRTGGSVLPMGIGKTLVHAEKPPTGIVRCVAHCRSTGESRSLANVEFFDEDGQRFTEFQDVELIHRPQSKNTGVRS